MGRWHTRNEEYKKRVRAKKRLTYAENIEHERKKSRENKRKQRATRRAEILAKQREWYAKNRERAAKSSRERRQERNPSRGINAAINSHRRGDIGLDEFIERVLKFTQRTDDLCARGLEKQE